MTEPFEGWAIVELMGHRRLAGYVSEQEIAGSGMIRVDVPGDAGATQLYSPSALYCLTPTTEDVARRVAATSAPEPVRPWELPERSAGSSEAVDEADVVDGPWGELAEP